MGDVIYGGESVGKKIARYVFWYRARLWHGENFTRLRHLVLASHEGGDIAVLTAFGVPQENIIAVDVDAGALATCRSKYPGIVTRHGDVRDVLAQQSCLGTVFLDFCGWASDEQVATVALAFRAVQKFGVVGHGFMRGREKGAAWERIVRERHEQEVRREQLMKRPEYAGVARRAMMRDVDGRDGWVLERLLERTAEMRIIPSLLWTVRYHSTCSWRHGVPMQIIARCADSLSPCLSEAEFKRERNRLGTDWCRALQWGEQKWVEASLAAGRNPNGEGTGFETHVQLSGMDQDPYGNLKRRLAFPGGRIFERDQSTLAALVEAAAVIETEFPGCAHEILNIRRARLAAMRAHAARGTYSNVALKRTGT